MSDEDRDAMIRSMVQRLADRLADNPDDLAGWRQLAKAYEVLGDRDLRGSHARSCFQIMRSKREGDKLCVSFTIWTTRRSP